MGIVYTRSLPIYSNFITTILLAAEQSIPRIKHKKISEQSGNPWWNIFCKQAVSPKREKFKKWLKNKTGKLCEYEKCKNMMQQNNSVSQKVSLV